MTTKELFEEIQEKLILNLKEDEVRCPRCKGLRFYFAEENGKGFIESCRRCYTGRLYVCKYCGKENRIEFCNCEEAMEERRRKLEEDERKKNAERYDKAEKLTPSEYDGWVYADRCGGYFEDVEGLKDYCYETEEEVPEWVYCCEEQKHALDIESAIESMCEDAFEDAKDYIKDEDELIAFVDKWNAKQNLTSYCVDYKRILILKQEGKMK